MIDWPSHEVGETRATCPSCGRGPRDRTLGVRIEPDGRGVAHCFRCEFRASTRSDASGAIAAPRPARTLERRETLSAWARDLWHSCGEISGPARDYLEARCCVVPPPDGHLRWHRKVRHAPCDYEGPALVALVTNALTGAPMTLHRTWIRADGRKADVTPARLLLGGHRKAGGVVRLWPDEDVTTGLGVAEGIESALALAHGHRPVWAAIDAGNLAALPPIPAIECLLIAADHDPTGIAAARACARTWTAAGRYVHIVMPGEAKTDLNDVARAAA